jgi:hypothetical protein
LLPLGGEARAAIAGEIERLLERGLLARREI